MDDIKSALSARILKNHRKCGYCGKNTKTAHELRRHIKTALHHQVYLQQLVSLYKEKAPLSTEIADPYTQSPDEFDVELPAGRGEPTYASVGTRTLLRRVTAGDGEYGRSSILEPPKTRDQNSSERLAFHIFSPDQLWRGSMHTIQDCPPQKKRLWESVGGMPVLLPKKKIYPRGSGHTDFDLYTHFLTADVSRVRIFADGIPSISTPKQRKAELLALAYYYKDAAPSDPPPGFRITASTVLDQDSRFYVPRIDGHPVPQGVEETEAIWVATGGITPAHIDHGKHVISSCVDQCRKYFFMWPSTQHNLKLYDRCAREGLLDSHFVSEAEGGLVENLQEWAIYMPPATVHMVETVVGGFIVTKAFINESTLIAMSRWFAGCASGLERVDDDQKETMLYNWISTAWLATPEDVVASWGLAGGFILSTLVVSTAGKKGLCALFKHIKKTRVAGLAEKVLEELKIL